MKKLTESGLLRHDLDDLILPMIDIDTFESKISNSKAVVVAFYLFEQDPARDLEMFIEKGPVDVLDAETSPAPTEDGYYVVFIELSRDDNLPEHLIDIIGSVENLTNIEQWQFKTLHDKSIYDLTEDNLRDHVNLDPKLVPPSTDEDEDAIEDKSDAAAEPEEEPEEGPEDEDELAEKLVPMLRQGMMESIQLQADRVLLRSGRDLLSYRVLDLGDSNPSLPIIAAEIGDPMIRESLMLGRMLGPSYVVEAVDGGLLVSSACGYVILAPID
jgi:hypothetical protein